jgi:hypothetical protein
MRCRKAQELIHLDRDEVPEGLRAKALKHAEACAHCAAELQLVRETAGSLARLRGSVPVLSRPEPFAQEIIRSIIREGIPDRRETPADWLPAIVPWRGVRLAVQSGAWCVLLFFVAQSLRDARSIARLEEQITTHSARRAEASVLSASSGPEALLHALRIGSLQPTMEMARLQERYPELWSISLEDGLDEREKRALATEGGAVLKELERLVKLGGERHER